MILGAVGCALTPPADRGFTLRAGDDAANGARASVYRTADRYGALDPRAALVVDPQSGCWLAFSGNPLAVQGAAVLARGEPMDAKRLLGILETRGLAALSNVQGQFAIAWWNARAATRACATQESTCCSTATKCFAPNSAARAISRSSISMARRDARRS